MISSLLNPTLDELGFSLIEIIMVLVLLGVIGALSSLGLESFIQTYSATQDAQAKISSGQMALLRIAKEVIAIKDLDTTYSNGTQIAFTTVHNDADYSLKIYKSGSEIHLAESSPESHDNILADSVDALSFSYYLWDSDNASNPFQAASSPTWSSDRCQVNIHEANYKGSENKIKFEFTPTSYGHFTIMYDNSSSTVTSTDSSKEKAEIVTGATVCDYAYVYAPGRVGQTMCFFKVAIGGDPFTSKTDPSCSALPSMSVISGQTVTRIIKIGLKMSGMDELNIMVAPRNIE